jgi:cytochrome c553
MTRLITLAAWAAWGIAFAPGVFAQAAAPQAVAPQAVAPQGNAELGSQKVAMCQGCHGIPGWRTAYPEVYSVPKIGGQHPAYLVKALQDYKSGARTHPSMRAIASSLTDADMADIAAYYAKHGLRTGS